MLKTLKTNRVAVIMLATVLVLSGVIAAIGSTLAANEITWEAQTTKVFAENRKVDLAKDDGRDSRLSFTVLGARSWNSTNTAVADIEAINGNTATYVAKGAGYFTAYRATGSGSLSAEEALVYDSTMPESYVITTDHTVLKAKDETKVIPITVKALNGDILTNAVSWTSADADIVAVNAATGELTAVADSGFARIVGTFTDCYGQEQAIVYSAIVGKVSADRTVQDEDGNPWTPNPSIPNIWDELDENGEPTGEHIYDEDLTGPADPTSPSIPVIKGEDNNFYVEEPTNIFTPVKPNGELDEENKIWGGPDGKPGNADDEKVKEFGANYYVDYGQNIFAEISPNGENLGELVGGGTDLNPTTSPVMPIFDNRDVNGKFYYGPIIESSETYYIGDKRSDGDGKVTSDNRPATIHVSDEKYYMSQDGGMSTTLPETEINATGITMDSSARSVEVGKTIIAPATAPIPAWATVETITWSSSDPAVATVDANSGVVTGVTAGKAEITVAMTNPDTSIVRVAYEVTVHEPASQGAGDVASDRELDDAQTGDGRWIEIATNGGYSLIVRAEEVGQTTFNFHITLGSIYRAYVTQDRHQRGNLRYEMNVWYEYHLPQSARLRNYVVKNDAMSRTGPWGVVSDASGFSVPSGERPSRTDGDVAFPLSFQEAANFLSKGYLPGGGFSSVEAVTNFEKLDYAYYGYPSGITPFLWLRSPGSNIPYASTLNHEGSLSSNESSRTDGKIFPALWVESSIFEQ